MVLRTQFDHPGARAAAATVARIRALLDGACVADSGALRHAFAAEAVAHPAVLPARVLPSGARPLGALLRSGELARASRADKERWIAQLAEGLAALHAAGFAHGAVCLDRACLLPCATGARLDAAWFDLSDSFVEGSCPRRVYVPSDDPPTYAPSPQRLALNRLQAEGAAFDFVVDEAAADVWAFGLAAADLWSKETRALAAALRASDRHSELEAALREQDEGVVSPSAAPRLPAQGDPASGDARVEALIRALACTTETGRPSMAEACAVLRGAGFTAFAHAQPSSPARRGRAEPLAARLPAMRRVLAALERCAPAARDVFSAIERDTRLAGLGPAGAAAALAETRRVCWCEAGSGHALLEDDATFQRFLLDALSRDVDSGGPRARPVDLEDADSANTELIARALRSEQITKAFLELDAALVRESVDPAASGQGTVAPRPFHHHHHRHHPLVPKTAAEFARIDEEEETIFVIEI
jgi:hypothetical protein